jgi:hypothetical protein
LAGCVDGFDCVLIVLMAATGVRGWMRRQLVVLPVFTTGILLICDAWFDVLTAGSARNLALWVAGVAIAAPVPGCPLAEEKTRKPVSITLGYRVFGDKSWT